MSREKSLSAWAAVAVALGACSPLVAQSAQISGLSDIDFGSITSSFDQISSQSVVVCSYRNNPQRLPYSVRATGSGNGGAFALSSSAASLPYDVQWADTAGQTGGTLLQPTTSATGFSNGATGFGCPTQSSNASLTVTIRSGDIAVAPAGSYSGTLQIMITPQ